MTEQSDFLDALGVSVDGVSIDDAAGPSAAHAPNPAGTNNYLHPSDDVLTIEGTSASRIATEQATYNSQAFQDFANHPSRQQNQEADDDDESTDSDALSEASYHRGHGPAMILLGIEDEPIDYGEYEDESEASMMDSEDGFSDPERILCQSDQDFPGRGHLFLVKWKNCSVLRSSWEWENLQNAYSDNPDLHYFLKMSHPIRMEWEARKERQARGEEERFDVVKWKANVEEDDGLRQRRRVLRRWKRRLQGIQRVLEAEQMDGQDEWHEDMVKRIDAEDRNDVEREKKDKENEAEKKRKRDELEDVE